MIARFSSVVWEERKSGGMTMRRRLAVCILVLVCLAAAAQADGVSLSTDWLPAGYRCVIEGANTVYADAPVPVYNGPGTSYPILNYVQPGDPVHVETAERDAGMAYVFYHTDPTDETWLFADNTPRGWMEAKYLTHFTDVEPVWVVTTDKAGNRLNLRAKPSYDSVSLGKFYAGAIVRQVEPPAGGYVKVRTPHLIDYMDMRYLQQGLYTETAELPFLTVTKTGGTTLRKLPQSNSEIIKAVPCGAVVMVTAVRDDDFLLVTYENETGFAPGSDMTPKLSY
jgi:uncharacterized protein YgiM (DUF1202 family)